jgi:RNA polymerase sigma-70 factor (ECF subfamily)
VDLVQAFRAQFDDERTVGRELDRALASAYERARTAWPTIAMPETRFAEHLAKALRDAPGLVDALDQLEAGDLYLALACALGDAAAIAAFDQSYVAPLRGPLARMGLDTSGIDDTLQTMRQELLADGDPRILNYSGRGPLRAWLRSVAARTGLRLIRKTPRHDELDDAKHSPVADDLELAYMKKTYGGVFQRAFHAALEGLDAADRLLLKQRFRHRMTVEQLGTLHGVHAGTISRRVEAARERLVKATRTQMMRELAVGRDDVESILRLIESELDITLSSHSSLER